MHSFSTAIAEIVEIPLVGSFSDFLQTFQVELLPVLLRENGVLSVRTGRKTRTSDNSAHEWAVSLTEWDSLESHAQFVQKPSSVSFFKKLESLVKGPPTIDHYAFGNMEELEGSQNMNFDFTYKHPGDQSRPGVVFAESSDNKGLHCTCQIKLLAGSSNPDVIRSFSVRWYSQEKKAMSRL